MSEQLESAPAPEVEIGQHDVERSLGEARNGLLHAVGHDRLVTEMSDHPHQRAGGERLVVHDQDSGRSGLGGGLGVVQHPRDSSPDYS